MFLPSDTGTRRSADEDRDKLVIFILTVIEGGVMQARAKRRLEPFDASVAMLRDDFERCLLQDENAIGENGEQR